VGERVFFSSLWEGLIGRDWLGQLGTVPGLATEWRRVSDSVIELSLRRGVRFHNGDELTAEDVVFTFSRDRMFGTTLASAHGRTIPIGEGMPAPRPGRSCRRRSPRSPAAPGRRWSGWRRWTATRSASTTRRPT
jgi:peptide/nickel transport system substrate-binding protein